MHGRAMRDGARGGTNDWTSFARITTLHTRPLSGVRRTGLLKTHRVWYLKPKLVTPFERVMHG